MILSPTGSISPHQQKPHGLLPLDAMWVDDPGTGAALCLEAWSGPGSRHHSSQGEAPTATL